MTRTPEEVVHLMIAHLRKREESGEPQLGNYWISKDTLRRLFGRTRLAESLVEALFDALYDSDPCCYLVDEVSNDDWYGVIKYEYFERLQESSFEEIDNPSGGSTFME